MKIVNHSLIQAAKSGSTKEIKRCLSDADCDPLIKDNDGFTALMWGAGYGHKDCVKLLLPVSDSLAQNINGNSALTMAAMTRHEACVKLLLPYSDPLAKDKNGWTALMWAIYFGREECVKILLPVSDPLAKDHDGCSASQIARDRGHSAVADMISAHIAQREGDILTGHVSLGPKEGQSRRKPTPRL